MIYRLPPGAAEPSCPNIGYLGDMMREHAGDEIIEYVAAGPKNYGLILRKPSVEEYAVLRVRGFGLHYR